MVAAEGAACGALPLSAAHSGLAEVTDVLADALEPQLRPLLSFARGPLAVDQIAAKLVGWLGLDGRERRRAAAALSERARRRFHWQSVAQSVIAAAQGRLEELPETRLGGEPPATPTG
jgi:glycosyltransferase involved in cell wall biosynthesis